VKIAITADHNGGAMKDRLVAWLRERGHEVDDRAAGAGDEVVDYPPLCEDLVTGAKAIAPDFAVLILDKSLSTPFRGERHAQRLASARALPGARGCRRGGPRKLEDVCEHVLAQPAAHVIRRLPRAELGAHAGQASIWYNLWTLANRLR